MKKYYKPEVKQVDLLVTLNQKKIFELKSN